MTESLATAPSGELLNGWDPVAPEHALDHDHQSPLTASLVVVRRGAEVLLVFDRWKQQWELPGGARERAESPRAAAERELAEETGLRTDALSFAGVSHYRWPDGRQERLAIFRTEVDHDPVAGFEPNDEIAELRWWDRTSPLEGLDPLDEKVIELALADDQRPAPNDITLQTYHRAADRYAERTPGPSADVRIPFLDRIVELVPGGRVLEFGSGPGRDAAYLESRGLQVQRSDAAPAFVELMRRDGHPATIIDARSDDLGGPWDAVLANAVLLHLSRTDFAEVVGRVLAAVRPGGIFAFTLKEGDGEAWTEQKLDLPRWFVYWREPALRAMVKGRGWTIRSLEHRPGRFDDWLQVIATAP
ncbi:NUDIX domain-containing protein [Microlunatus elymi]|uniref:NUDIX domain-containing protein n=1 Tax=Microlunatus elymi TaxID=2596828 RepID=UPI00143D88ED|nr:NUDIX domain-containing protein [Microlunatus elymi]